MGRSKTQLLDSCAYPDSLVGKQFGNYEVLELVSHSMALLYKARQSSPNRLVALKVPEGGRSASEEVRRRFAREIALNVGMSHPNIVGVLDAGEMEGVPFYTMQFIEGQRLDWHVEEERPSMAWRVGVFRKICEVVKTLHRDGLIHRDLKSSNIMIDKNGEVRLLDFGLAKLYSSDSSESTGEPNAAEQLVVGDMAITQGDSRMGTPRYMAPEQTCPGQVITTAADVYSLGVVLYWLLTDNYPYPLEGSFETLFRTIREHIPQAPSALNRSVPEGLDLLALDCLQKDPSARPADASELLERLTECWRAMEARANPVVRFLHFWTWWRATAVMLSVLVLAFSGGALWHWRQKQGALDRMIAAYRDMQTYHDFSTMRQQMGATVLTANNEFTFTKPNKFRLRSRLEWSGIAMEADCYCNGTNLWVHFPHLKQYMEKSAPASIMDLVDKGAKSDPANDLVRYSLKAYEPVLSPKPEQVIAGRAQKLSISKAETLDRKPVYRLEWAESVILSTHTNRSPIASHKVPIQIPFQAWVRQEDGLFVELQADLSQLYSSLDKSPMYHGFLGFVGTNCHLKASHTDIRVNAQLDQTQFDFKRPAGHRKVSRFEWEKALTEPLKEALPGLFR